MWEHKKDNIQEQQPEKGKKDFCPALDPFMIASHVSLNLLSSSQNISFDSQLSNVLHSHNSFQSLW